MRPLHDEHHGTKACNHAHSHPTLRTGVHRISLAAPLDASMIPNIKENPRNRKATKRGRKRLFNEALHALRMRIERTFAWEDKFIV
jgi:hypothetical protein